jgi:ethanolamine utilization microcompartment shell protein EutS
MNPRAPAPATADDIAGLSYRLRIVEGLLVELLVKVDDLQMSQDALNTAVAQVTAFLTDIQGQVAQLGTDVTNLTAALQSGTVDVSGAVALGNSVASIQSSLDSAVSQVTGLAPGAPATPPPPASS